jgi:cytochrome c-type biogenesis protein CcmH
MKRFPNLLALAALLISVLASPALAVLPDEKLSDPRLEIRAMTLSKELRCVVCQNENIDDSAAPIARDMRLLLRERIAAGDSNDEAVAYLVNRYGNYVLLRPPFQADTVVLWLAPFAVLLIASLLLGMGLRRRSMGAGPVDKMADDANWDEAGGPSLELRRS